MLKYICSDVYSGASLKIVRWQEKKKGRKIEMRKKGRREDKEELSKKNKRRQESRQRNKETSCVAHPTTHTRKQKWK